MPGHNPDRPPGYDPDRPPGYDPDRPPGFDPGRHAQDRSPRHAPDQPPARLWHLARTVLTAVNGTTGIGLVIALATGAKIKRGRHGVLIAEGYRRKVPPATCFTIGSVILTRRTADWLLDPEREHLLHHESRHAGQYAVFGPLFWPAYWISCGYSYAVTGSYGTRNAFEKHAGLDGGGYRERPLRPWAARLSGRIRPSAATASTNRPPGTPSPH